MTLTGNVRIVKIYYISMKKNHFVAHHILAFLKDCFLRALMDSNSHKNEMFPEFRSILFRCSNLIKFYKFCINQIILIFTTQSTVSTKSTVKFLNQFFLTSQKGLYANSFCLKYDEKHSINKIQWHLSAKTSEKGGMTKKFPNEIEIYLFVWDFLYEIISHS